MNIRESSEQWEKEYLSPYAMLSMYSKGRSKPEEQCDIRPVFQRDRDRIIHSKSFRRLKDKTQVFLTPEGDHYRTRLTHTLEVSQNARTIAKALQFGDRILIHIFKHKFPQFLHGIRHILRHTDIISATARCDDVVDKIIQALSAAVADHISDLFWHIGFF